MKILKYLLNQDRKRFINSGFAFVPHKFLFDGYFSMLSKEELALYFFLVLAADKDGLSYFSYTKICNLLRIEIDEYINIRNSLIKKDLIAFDGQLFQVLSLPESPLEKISKILETRDDFIEKDPATIHQIIKEGLSIC